jgi:hypothetical protein
LFQQFVISKFSHNCREALGLVKSTFKEATRAACFWRVGWNFHAAPCADGGASLRFDGQTFARLQCGLDFTAGYVRSIAQCNKRPEILTGRILDQENVRGRARQRDYTVGLITGY